MFMLCWTFFAVSIIFILKAVILCVCVLFQAGHILHAFAWFIYGSQSNKSLLIQTLVVVLQNCGRKAIVITFVCTWLGNRQMTLIVSHCSQRLEHTVHFTGLKVQDTELYFHTARLHQHEILLQSSWLPTRSWGNHKAKILNTHLACDHIFAIRREGECSDGLPVKWESGMKYLRQCWRTCILLVQRLPLCLFTYCLSQ